MAISRVSWLFAVTTSPTNTTAAAPHSGGWSESHWSNRIEPAGSRQILNFAQKRAILLPQQAAIIGYRIEAFTISGNKLLPGGTSGAKFLYTGGQGLDLNLPQDALQVSATGTTVPNTARFNLRGLPDTQVVGGEWQPTPAWRGGFTNWANGLLADGWGFVGRVRSSTARVMGITQAGVMTLSANIGGVANQDFIRLLRVYDVNGNPVKGSYAIQTVAANVYTLTGWNGQTVSKPSGLARLDAIAWYQYGTINPNRAVVRKIGRPFEQYRGRRSKSRV